MPPAAFVINLPASTERRARVTSSLAALGIPFTMMEAIDGRRLTGGDAALTTVAQPHLGRPLSAGEVGCLRSHLAALERVVRQGLPLACIFEDDIALDTDTARVLNAIAAGPRSWDVLLLGHHSARHPPRAGVATCYRRRPLIANRAIARVVEFPMGAYAYVVTLSGARALLAHASPLRMPMDWVTGYSPAAGAMLHAVTPPCVTPEHGDVAVSTIGGRELAAAPPPGPAQRLRTASGRAWLLARKAGLWPDGYARRY